MQRMALKLDSLFMLAFLIVSLAVPFVFYTKLEEPFLQTKWAFFYLAALIGVYQLSKICKREAALLFGLLLVWIFPSLINSKEDIFEPVAIYFAVIVYIAAGRMLFSKIMIRPKALNYFVYGFPWLTVVLSIVIMPAEYDSGYRSIFFYLQGHPNYFAEFLAYFVVLQIHNFIAFQKNGKLFQKVSSILLLTAIVASLHSRTSILVILFGAVAAVGLTGKLSFRAFASLSVMALLVMCVSFSTKSTFLKLHNLNPSGPSIEVIKNAGIELRVARWSNALRMIKDKPFGYGMTGFEYNYLSYYMPMKEYPISYNAKLDNEIHESITASSPHNVLIDIAIRFGLQALILSLGIFGYLIHSSVKRYRHETNLRKKYLLGVGLLGVLSILCMSLFSVPFDTAYMNILFFISIGLLINKKHERVNKSGIAVTVIATVILLTYLSLHMFSNYAYSRYNQKYNDMSLACKMLPSFKENCLKKGHFEFETLGDREKSKITLNQILTNEPNYFPAIRILIDIHLAENDHTSACKYLLWYKRHFIGASTNALFDRYCNE